MVQHLKSYVSWIDFVLDWTKENHRQAVVTALADKYNAYHYKLHKHYLKYASHEEALSDGMSLVEKGNGYVKASPFKEQSQRNITNRKRQKVKHTGGGKSFVRIMEENRYTKMHVGSCFRQGFQQGEKQLDGTTLCGTRWRELTTTNRSNWIGSLSALSCVDEEDIWWSSGQIKSC
ncbi:uncharacterized protein LOC109002123 isoform X2 [Juglans regia]|uniref:Uncharacterized protein LOC109002123 isoform X2 n=2 Tax=Juglans regia TaxID=51240 RepID=A0A6P9E6X5_JUGRE|nr:uncharacterized protein LOC109002123 isoform X2 [Juglans regia]